jgi:hypothetical protein
MLGPIHEDDHAFLQVVELTGKTIDEIKRGTKASTLTEAKPQQNTIEK